MRVVVDGIGWYVYNMVCMCDECDGLGRPHQ